MVSFSGNVGFGKYFDGNDHLSCCFLGWAHLKQNKANEILQTLYRKWVKPFIRDVLKMYGSEVSETSLCLVHGGVFPNQP